MKLRVLLILLLIIFISCREIIPFETEEKINGYQINGLVTDYSGRPLDSVLVYLFYSLRKISSNPIDTTNIIIRDTNDIVSVDVYDVEGNFVKNILKSNLPAGLLPRYNWNGEIAPNIYAESGFYKIIITINNHRIKEYPILVQGTLTSQSDSSGRFYIYNKNLPIGKIYDYYDYQNRYTGTFIIEPYVILELVYKGKLKRGSLSLQKDQITKVTVSF